MVLNEIKRIIEIPEGIEVVLDDFVTVRGYNRELKRKVKSPALIIEKEDKKIILKAKGANKLAKRTVGTAIAHIKNMITGVKNNYVYKLKMCSSHFPMNVSIANNEITIRNFLGEKYPRITKLKGNIAVKLEKDTITIEGTDKEITGQAAADIEKLTLVRNRDRRRFQDGIFITERPK